MVEGHIRYCAGQRGHSVNRDGHAEGEGLPVSRAGDDYAADRSWRERHVVESVAAFLVVGVVSVRCGIVVGPQHVKQAAAGPRTEV